MNSIQTVWDAIRRGNLTDVQRFFEEEGISLDTAQEDTERRPIHEAASLGRIDVVKYLIQQRADIDSQDREGCTPLHVAVLKSKENAIEILLREGADTGIRDGDGMTAAEIFYESNKGVLNSSYPKISSLETTRRIGRLFSEKVKESARRTEQQLQRLQQQRSAFDPEREEKHVSPAVSSKLVRRFQGLERAQKAQEEELDSWERHEQISHEMLTMIGDYGETVSRRHKTHQREQLLQVTIGSSLFALKVMGGQLLLASTQVADTTSRVQHLQQLGAVEAAQIQGANQLLEQRLRLGLMGVPEERTFEEFIDAPQAVESVDLTTHEDLLYFLKEIGVSAATMAAGFGTTEQRIGSFFAQDTRQSKPSSGASPSALSEETLRENIKMARRNAHLNQRIYRCLKEEIQDYVQSLKSYIQTQKKALTQQAIDALNKEVNRQIRIAFLHLASGEALSLIAKLKTIYKTRRDIQELSDESYTDEAALGFGELASQRTGSTHSSFVSSVASAFEKLDVRQYVDLVQFLLDLGMSDRQIADIFAEKDAIKITQLIDDETSQLIRPEQAPPKAISSKDLSNLRKALSKERQNKLYALKKKLRAFVESNERLFASLKPLLRARKDVEKAFQLLLSPQGGPLSARMQAVMQFWWQDLEFVRECLIRHRQLCDEEGNNWLHLAARYAFPAQRTIAKEVDFFCFLLETTEDLNATNHRQSSALEMALTAGNLGLVRLLLPRLESIELSLGRMDAGEFLPLANLLLILPTAIAIRELNLDGTILQQGEGGISFIRCLAKALPYLKELSSLALNDMSLTDEDARALANALPRCERLMQLNLCDNRITNKSASVLQTAKAQCPRLKTILLENNPISEEHQRRLAIPSSGNRAREAEIVDEAVYYDLSHLPYFTLLQVDAEKIDHPMFDSFKRFANTNRLVSLTYWPQNMEAAGVQTRIKKLPDSALHFHDTNSPSARGLVQLLPSTAFTNLELEFSDERTRYEFEKGNIGDEAAIALAEVLPRSHVAALIFKNGVGTSGAMALSKALPRTRITALKGPVLPTVLPDTAITTLETGFSLALAEILPRTAIATLALGGVGDGAIALAKVLPHTAITTLNLERNGIDAKSMTALIEVLPRTRINNANLSGNSFDAKSIAALAEALPRTRMATLSLRSDSIRDEDVITLAKVLPSTTIAILEISWRSDNVAFQSLGISETTLKTLGRVPDTGARALAEALPRTAITELNLHGNRIGVEGVRALAATLPRTAIRSLNLSSNGMGEEGAKALAEILPRTAVAHLDLTANEIGDGGAKALAKVLPHTRLNSLQLGPNSIGDEGIIALAEALPRTTIDNLYLSESDRGDGKSHNKFSDTGVIALARALPRTAMTSLVLMGDGLSDESAVALIEALPHTAITDIVLFLGGTSMANKRKIEDIVETNQRYFENFMRAIEELESVGVIQTHAKRVRLSQLGSAYRPYSGYSPLHLAVRKGNVSAVEWLLSEGVDVKLKTSSENAPLEDRGKTALQLAEEYHQQTGDLQYRTIAEILRKAEEASAAHSKKEASGMAKKWGRS